MIFSVTELTEEFQTACDVVGDDDLIAGAAVFSGCESKILKTADYAVWNQTPRSPGAESPVGIGAKPSANQGLGEIPDGE